MFSIKQHIWRQRDYFDIATCSEWTLMFQPGNYTYRYGLLHIWRHITMSWILIMRTEQNAEFSILHTHAHTNTHTHPGCYSCQVQWGRAAMMWVMRWKKTNLGSLQITTHSQTHTHTHTLNVTLFTWEIASVSLLAFISLSHTHTYTHLKSYGMSNPKRCSRVENRFCSIIPLGRESKHPPKHRDRSTTHTHTHTHTHIACIHTAYIVYTLECSEAWGQCYVQWWVFCSYGGEKKKSDETHSLWNICAKICSTKCRWWKHWWTTTATQTIMKTHTPNMHKI